MPIARFEMPDGRIARFEVPEGTTPEQAQALIEPEIAKMGAAAASAKAKEYEGFAPGQDSPLSGIVPEQAPLVQPAMETPTTANAEAQKVRSAVLGPLEAELPNIVPTPVKPEQTARWLAMNQRPQEAARLVAADKAAGQAYRKTRKKEMRAQVPEIQDVTIDAALNQEQVAGQQVDLGAPLTFTETPNDKLHQGVRQFADRNPRIGDTLAGVAKAGSGLWGTLEGAFRLGGMDYHAGAASAIQESTNKFVEDLQSQASREHFADTDSKANWMLSQFLTNAPSLLMSGLGMLNPGSAGTVLGTMAATVGGGQYHKLVQDGINPDIAATAGMAYGMVEALTERLPLELGSRVLKQFRSLSTEAQAQVGKRLAYGLGFGVAAPVTEGLEEGVAQYGQQWIDVATGKAQHALAGENAASGKLESTDTGVFNKSMQDSFMGGVAGGFGHGAVIGGALASGAMSQPDKGALFAQVLDQNIEGIEPLTGTLGRNRPPQNFTAAAPAETGQPAGADIATDFANAVGATPTPAPTADIGRSDGKPFVSQATAEMVQRINNLTGTHQVVPAEDGSGFVIRAVAPVVGDQNGPVDTTLQAAQMVAPSVAGADSFVPGGGVAVGAPVPGGLGSGSGSPGVAQPGTGTAGTVGSPGAAQGAVDPALFPSGSPASNRTDNDIIQEANRGFAEINRTKGFRPGDGSYRARVELAGEADLSPAVRAGRRAAAVLEKLFNTRIVYVKSAEPGQGLTYDGTILADGQVTLIAADSARPVTRVVVHELVHAMKRRGVEGAAMYQGLRDTLLASVNEPKVREHLVRRGYLSPENAADALRNLTDAEFEEFVADLVSDVMHRPESLARLASKLEGQEKGLGRKFLEAIQDLLDAIVQALKGGGMGAEAAIRTGELAKARKAVVNAMALFQQMERNGKTGSASRGGQAASNRDTINVDGVERPTTNSNGRRIAQTEEGLRNFWKWFGDSKVVDSEGRPLVMYRGRPDDSGSGAIRLNDSGLIFATPIPGFANDYAGASWNEMSRLGSNRSGNSPYVSPIYVRATNIFDAATHDGYAAYKARFGEKRADKAKDEGIGWIEMENIVVRDWLAESGYDGLRIREHLVENVAVFTPNQIKSAIGNNGNFNSDSDNILFSNRDTAPMLHQGAKGRAYRVWAPGGKFQGVRVLDGAQAREMKDKGYELQDDGTENRMAFSERKVGSARSEATVKDDKEAARIRKFGFPVRAGVIAGAPGFIHSLANIKAQIRRAVEDAASDWSHPEDAVWYREAGRAIREYSHGDVALMEKLTRVVAKLSQAAGVDSNVTNVIKAAYKIVADEPLTVGRYPNVNAEFFRVALAAPEFDNTLTGVDTKLQNFYRNLHDEAFQENRWPEAVVIDRHALAYIWNNKERNAVMSDGEYNYASQIITKAAEEYNKKYGTALMPRDMQALLWGWWKRRDEAEAARAEGKEYRATGTAWNYPQFFDRATARITAEVLPSVKTSALDTRLTAEEKQQFQREALNLIFDEQGRNELAQRAGIVLYTQNESTGGYEAKVNPNLILGGIAQKIPKTKANSGDPYHRYLYDAIDRYALGWQYIFKQDGVPWFRADKTLDPADLDKARAERAARRAKGRKVAEAAEPPVMAQGFYITFDRDLSLEDEAALLAALQGDIHADVGYTKIKPNSVAVINYRGEDGTPFMMPDADFRAAIHKFQHFEGVTSTESFAAETRYHYHDFSEDPQATGLLARTEIQSGQRDFSGWLRGRREAFDALVSRWENDTPFSNREPNAASAERDGGTDAGTGRPVYGRAREGAVSGVGVHYSTQARQSLSGSYYGRGLEGAEYARVMAAADQRLRFRIYFYLNDGQGVMPESGVGPYPHTVQLNNLYDREADPLMLFGQGDSLAALLNNFESAVIDAGFDGYITQFGNQRAAVLLGRRHNDVPVRLEPIGYRGEDTAPAGRSEPNAYKKMQQAVVGNQALPGGQVSGRAWKRLMARVMPEVDVSHLDDETIYYKDQIVRKPAADMPMSNRFFSPLAEAVSAARMDSQPAPQWKLWLQANKGKLGLKDDEIQWSGINDYLDLRGKDKVTKAEIADYLNGNGVKVQDVVKGRTGGELYVAEANDFGDEWAVFDEEGAILGGTFSSEGEAQDAMAEMNEESPTKFSSYWEDSYKGGIPGTYREILVTLPVLDPADRAAKDLFGKMADDLNREERKAMLERMATQKPEPTFSSNHWDEKNVLVHVRLDEVVGADGKRYVRVGEIQSDWGQKGKKEGFRLTKQKAVVEPATEGVGWVVRAEDGTALIQTTNRERAEQKAAEYNSAGGLPQGVPAAPFVTDTKAWVALGIKRAIMHALDVGADGVVFGTGEQNANLYDLSKQVSSISYMKRADGTYHVVAGRLDREGDVELGSNNTEQDLEEKVGKDIARKIINGEGEFSGGDMTTLRGLDLKVGGEGMRAFYDKIVPQVANGVLKKLGGGKVASVAIAQEKTAAAKRENSIRRKTGEPLVDEKTVSQPGFLIPDAMRAKVEEQGVPLFSNRSTPEELRDKFSALVAQGDERVKAWMDQATEGSEKDWEAAKRFTVPHAVTEENAKELATRLGLSMDAMQAALAQGSVTVDGKQYHPAEVLAAASQVVRVSVVRLLEAPNANDFVKRLVDTINLIVATRANLSEIGRALGHAGFLQRQGGSRGATKAKAGQVAKVANGLVTPEAGANEAERAAVAEYNKLMLDAAENQMAAEEAQIAADALQQEIQDAEAKAKAAHQALKDANQKKRDAERRIKEANKKEANWINRMPLAAEIAQAEADALKAEQAARQAILDARAARKALTLARARLKRAVDRATGALAAAAKARAALAKVPRASTFLGKAGVSTDDIVNALGKGNWILRKLGWKYGIARVQAAIAQYGHNLDVDTVDHFLRGLANAIYDRKKEHAEAVQRSTVSRLARKVVGDDPQSAAGKVLLDVADFRLLSAALEMFRAMIVTGFRTHEINVMSNAVFSALDMAVVRSLSSMAPGDAGLPTHVRAVIGGLMKTLSEAGAAMRYGFFAEYPAMRFEVLAKADRDTRLMLEGLEGGQSKWVDSHGKHHIPGLFGRVVRTVGFSPLGAEDSVAKILPYWYEVGKQQALGQPVDYGKAIELAKNNTFNSDLGQFAAGLNTLLERWPSVALVTQIVFVRIMLNLTKRAAELTPVLSQVMHASALAGLDGPEARNIAYARSLVSIGVLVLLSAMYGEGEDDEENRIRGLTPVDPKDRELWQAAYGNPLATKIGDSWWDLGRVDPLASVAGMTLAGIKAARALDEEGARAAGEELAKGVNQMILGKNWMAGPKAFMDAVQTGSLVSDEEHKGYFDNKLAKSVIWGMLIPNALSQAGDAFDPTVREPHTFLEAGMRKIPWMRDELDPKLDIAGRPMENTRFANAWPATRTPKTDDVAKSLMRMEASLDVSPKTLDGLPLAERERLLQARYTMLQIATKVLDTVPADNEIKQKVIRDAVTSKFARIVKSARLQYGLPIGNKLIDQANQADAKDAAAREAMRKLDQEAEAAATP